jgi:ATP-dependent RNA helicase DDX41
MGAIAVQVYLLECLQKTAPPVIIFCENKADVDDIHEYLLLKGVDAAAIHGGKDQEEREEAVRLFKAGVKDVLVATDVASKGLDFPNIQHVINYDMPKEVENYGSIWHPFAVFCFSLVVLTKNRVIIVHRIGRTGRGGRTGVATTFVNKMTPLTTLLDLKQLLVEAKQKVPQFLVDLDPEGDTENLASETGMPDLLRRRKWGVSGG